MDIDLKQIRELMRAMKQLDVNELELEQGEERIFLRRGVGANMGGMQPTMLTQSFPPPPPVPTLAAEPRAAAEEDSGTYITSPFVGTFYRSPSPDAGPFIEVGQEIRPGQVLCIVEAMKLMNEIESEIGGTILEILAENGKPVEYGDRLFKVRSAGA